MKSLQIPPYFSPAWIIGGHTQTIWPVVFQRRSMTWARSQWETPDGDVIAVDARPGQADRPLVVLFHGLEGSSRSHYATSLAHELERQSWGLVMPHFRTCGGLDNRLPRAYFAGDSTEIAWMLARLRNEYPGRPLFAVGVSLGGNALLKWLGEAGEGAKQLVQAAVGVSVPLDLTASGQALRHGFNRHVYTRHFIHTLLPKTLAKLAKHPELTAQIDRRQLAAARTLYEFDNLYTAPMHGYRDVQDYWLRASSKPGLRQIAVPTLVLNARNDPFVPAASLPMVDEVSASVMLLQPEEGGHVGFTSGPFPGRNNWLPQTLVSFFRYHSHP